MLPKELLKYAEKVEDVEAEVLKELKKREQQLPRQSPLFVPGQIFQASQLEQLRNSQLQQLQASQLQQLQRAAQEGARGVWETFM